MKYIWEPKDIYSGRVIQHMNGERYIIGYDAHIDAVAGNMMVISLIDGCILSPGKTKEDLAIQLTKDDMEPLSVDPLVVAFMKNGS